jgi:hypothetical protein
MDLFGFDDRIIDNILEHEERQLFYLLESVGFLSTEREEIFLHDGRSWRIHYWTIKKKKIRLFSERRFHDQSYRVEKVEKTPYETIYSYLPKYVWTTRKL